MKITMQYFDGCPHWNVAEKRLLSVLRRLDCDEVVDHQLIESPEAAECRPRLQDASGSGDGWASSQAQAQGVGLQLKVCRRRAQRIIRLLSRS